MPDRTHAIAVVDDEADVRRALERLFRSAGLAVEAFPTGSAFVDSLVQGTPDCVVLDLHMAGLSGFEVQELLVRRRVDVPVVVITGDDSDSARERVLAGGAYAYLTKPVDGEALLGVVRAAVSSGGSRERVP